MSAPLFSVVVTTYNRAGMIRRCVDSCLEQTMPELEVVVVDDGSTDDTPAVLGAYDDPRLRVVRHDRNRGISPARHSGAQASKGEWVVVVDSDWELMPDALERLAEIVRGLPESVRVIRSRLRWDDGAVTPRFVPPGPIDYEGRIRWAEGEGGHDAMHTIERGVFEQTPFHAERRGAMESLYELELAKRERTLYIADILGKEHTDASNSWLRTVAADELVPRLFEEAPDMLWMAETTLAEHGPALARLGPRQYRTMLRVASMQAFLLGDRRKGARFARLGLARRPLDPMVWVTLSLGLLGPRAVARGALAFRWLISLRP